MERIGGDVWWPETGPGLQVRGAAGVEHGGLVDLAVWAAETQNGFPPRPYRRVRLIVAGADPTERVVSLAEAVGATLVPPPVIGTDVPGAIEAAAAAVDAEVESGTDLLVVAAPGARIAAAAVVSTLTGTEPVKVLRRGAAAADADAWMARAVAVRDARLLINLRRGRADPLLNGLGDPLVAFTAGVLVAAAARRTPVLLDGPLVHAAALVAALGRPAAAAWWRAADTSTDPAVSLAQDRLRLEPVLGLGTDAGDGTAGLLCVPVLRAATAIVPHTNDSESLDVRQ
jgi:nicotinate-nucleotide--dimethylbenzimidazole phosphoribosyltransferase